MIDASKHIFRRCIVLGHRSREDATDGDSIDVILQHQSERDVAFCDRARNDTFNFALPTRSVKTIPYLKSKGRNHFFLVAYGESMVPRHTQMLALIIRFARSSRS